MSKLDELIAELCPDGVEYKTIGEIATDIYRGSGITRDQITNEGIPCIRYGEIYTTYGIWFDECVSHTNESQIANKKYFEYGDILFAITGESVEEIAKSCAYVGHEKCLAGGDIVVLKHKEDPKYLAYALSTTDAQIQKSKGKVKSKVVHSSVPAIKEIKLPVPPLEVQREIVRVLDNFTFLTAELTAELTARRKQYEYYRNNLLSFKTEVNNLKIQEICDISRGKVISKDDIRENPGQYPVYSSQTENNGELGKISTYMYDGEYLTWTTDGANAGSIFYRNGKFNITNVCGLLKVTDSKVNIRYLFHMLSVVTPKYVSRGMGNPKLMSNVMGNIKINIPSIEVQNRVANILDNFDAVCNDLNIGLPAEINARKKQYEYYRDFLLTFVQNGDSILAEQSRAEQSRAEQSRAEQSIIKLLWYVFGYVKMELSDIFETKNGYTPSKSEKRFWNGKTVVPWFRMEDIRENGRILTDSSQHVTAEAVKGNLFPENSIIISTSATIGEYALIKVPSLANQRFTYLTLKEEFKNLIDVQYIFHYCFKLEEYCKAHLNQGNFASVDMASFSRFIFTIPSLEKQKEIAATLDRFDKLCNDISSGLPAEIAMRQKQYDYYRDKLLSFEELKQ